jgi:hypothetical protein
VPAISTVEVYDTAIDAWTSGALRGARPPKPAAPACTLAVRYLRRSPAQQQQRLARCTAVIPDDSVMVCVRRSESGSTWISRGPHGVPSVVCPAGTKMPSARLSTAAAVIASRSLVYVCGGWPSNGEKLEIFSLSTNTWTSGPALPLPLPHLPNMSTRAHPSPHTVTSPIPKTPHASTSPHSLSRPRLVRNGGFHRR